MPQRIPSVGSADVERVVRREFPRQLQASALEVLGEFVSESGEPHRVQLAALKLSSGDLGKLRDWIEHANLDFRDVLAAAEYPLAMTRTASMDSLSTGEREAIYDADWRQYETWLQRS
jgi:hypothetical protein